MEEFIAIILKYWILSDVMGLVTVGCWIFLVAPPAYVPSNKATLDCVTPAQRAAFYCIIVSSAALVDILCLLIAMGLLIKMFG